MPNTAIPKNPRAPCPFCKRDTITTRFANHLLGRCREAFRAKYKDQIALSAKRDYFTLQLTDGSYIYLNLGTEQSLRKGQCMSIMDKDRRAHREKCLALVAPPEELADEEPEDGEPVKTKVVIKEVVKEVIREVQVGSTADTDLALSAIAEMRDSIKYEIENNYLDSRRFIDFMRSRYNEQFKEMYEEYRASCGEDDSEDEEDEELQEMLEDVDIRRPVVLKRFPKINDSEWLAQYKNFIPR